MVNAYFQEVHHARVLLLFKPTMLRDEGALDQKECGHPPMDWRPIRFQVPVKVRDLFS
jgi:hypothetical protein